ncbi:MAG: carbamoyl phosphate synthase large subunit [candidate division NC10 bacterium RIFCSPLOWO2_12_FULL_66_18]|nr:MAG: carbamoyl phosphate synthase large subunit [candidate division NC10 bacterium RIFCSPLOWO2_12_FULL_66_18]
MPKRTDLRTILIIGSGPIVIGQGCEFDYSGTQGCKSLREEGYRVVLVNSNPATIMTDPEFGDRTYIEPLTPEVVAAIIEKERPDALLPTLGGQTALNIAVALAESGVLDRHRVELIGAKLPAIKKAEDRDLFKQAMTRIGLEVPESGYARSMEDALEIIQHVGYPAIIRPSFTLGGTGGNIAYNREEFEEYVQWGLNLSPVRRVLIEASVIGWKEYELEVMRDLKDNVVIICSIENFDPMGIHTGDSITVAPAQTLTDKEYQMMRDAAIAIIREIGVETGGSNIQFAVDPATGRLVVIEMNPRVSRSSALASKATGFPIAKIAAKLAIGYTLDEIRNDITRETPASFEPTIDYCVVKYPRWAFEKFPGADDTLTTQMKSVGEAMAIGRTFKEALQKAIRSLEIDAYGLESRARDGQEGREAVLKSIRESLRVPKWDRVFHIAEALRLGMDLEEIHGLTKIDPWFLANIQQIVEFEERLRRPESGRSPLMRLLTDPVMREAKAMGFSDRRLAKLVGSDELTVRDARKRMGIEATFKMVDTCAAEFVAYTPYFYSTYERECEANPTDRPKVVILGAGPNRIGQGIEFDYCCVHAVFGLRELGYETIMVNCNPETVSTDYDTADRLYFEPLTLEDVLNIVEREKPTGVIVQFGGQTPLKLAVPLQRAGVKILGTSPDAIDRAEDRERFKQLLQKLRLNQPPNGTALSFHQAALIARQIGYPVLVRPSYVLGGRAMEIVYDEEDLRDYMARAVQASPDHPILVDKFLEDAIEMDVDAVSDGQTVVIGGIMEHIEEAGIHSGDSACSLPPRSISDTLLKEIREQTAAMALELHVVGLINIQFAIKDRVVYVLEVNPRASRTVPFVSKAIGVPLAKLAAKAMVGATLKELGFTEERKLNHVAVKEAVLPFAKFPNVDTVLGPEMKSTGEVMGIDADFGRAFAKSQIAANGNLPLSGTVFLSVRDKDKPTVAALATQLAELGFRLIATEGTAAVIQRAGVPVERVYKVSEGLRPHVVDKMKNGEVTLVINTPEGRSARMDSYPIRRAAVTLGIPYFTTMAAASAAAEAIRALRQRGMGIRALQDYHTTA